MKFYNRINPKQRQLAKLMANGNYKSKAAAMREVGYADATADHPGRAIRSRGVQLALVEEATKVGNIIDGMSARLATENWEDYTASEVVDMLKKLSEAQKNVMSCIPQPKAKDNPQEWNVIDINVE